MKRYSEDLINEARILRQLKRLSYREIGRRINVPSGTIGNWFQGPVGNRWDSLIRTNEERRQKYKNSETSVVSVLNLMNKKQIKLLTGILYGCEGSKYPATKGVSFSNSDPGLILAFLELLKKSFYLNEEKFSVHLQIHSTHNYEKIKKFWSSLLGISEKHFIKPTITNPTGNKHRVNYQGTCTLRYRDYRIQLKLLGIFEAFTKNYLKDSLKGYKLI
jgi:transcriptional regulator with XRE-family HTH domain